MLLFSDKADAVSVWKKKDEERRKKQENRERQRRDDEEKKMREIEKTVDRKIREEGVTNEKRKISAVRELLSVIW